MSHFNFWPATENVTTCPFRRVAITNHFFFSILVFFHEHSRLTWQQGKGKGICLIPLYHFHTLQRQLEISQVITAESSPLYIASIVAGPEMGTFARQSLTNRLRELQTDHSKITFVQSGCYVQQFGFVVFIFRSSHQRCSLKKLFLKILQNSQENTCAGDFFSLLFCSLWSNMVGIDSSINFRGPFAVK